MCYEYECEQRDTYNKDREREFYREKEGNYGYRPKFPMERRRGYYVRKPREDHEAKRGSRGNYQPSLTSRKGQPRQMWVAKEGYDRQDGNDTFICDTRRKTTTMFDRISENDDRAADPAREQGRRHQ